MSKILKFGKRNFHDEHIGLFSPASYSELNTWYEMINKVCI